MERGVVKAGEGTIGKMEEKTDERKSLGCSRSESWERH